MQAQPREGISKIIFWKYPFFCMLIYSYYRLLSTVHQEYPLFKVYCAKTKLALPKIGDTRRRINFTKILPIYMMAVQA